MIADLFARISKCVFENSLYNGFWMCLNLVFNFKTSFSLQKRTKIPYYQRRFKSKLKWSMGHPILEGKHNRILPTVLRAIFLFLGLVYKRNLINSRYKIGGSCSTTNKWFLDKIGSSACRYTRPGTIRIVIKALSLLKILMPLSTALTHCAFSCFILISREEGKACNSSRNFKKSEYSTLSFCEM